MIFNILQQRGFTLLETMVAIAILLIAVVGPISIMGGSFSKIYFVRDQMIAVNLGQEAIEAIRQARDTNMLAGDTWWDDGFRQNQCGVGTKECVVNFSSGSVGPTITSCGGTACTPPESLVYTDSDGFYHQYLSVTGTAVPTIFHRTVKTEKISDTEDKIISTVTWNTGNIPGSVVSSESILKWAQ